MRMSVIVPVVTSAAVVSALAFGWAITQMPEPVERALVTASPAPSTTPVTQYTFEGDTDSQLSQALQALMYDHGYSGALTGPGLTGRMKLTTLAPQPVIDAVFGSIDVELTVVEGEIVGQ